jgi:acyl dehydratase
VVSTPQPGTAGDGSAAGIAAASTRAEAPTQVGHAFGRRVRLTTAEIRAFATSVDDRNPLHHDLDVARAAGYPGLIASGTQLASLMMAATATHYSAADADGRSRPGLGLGFDIRFRAVVLADEDIEMRWTVTSVQRKDRLDAWIVQLEGESRSARGVLMSATGSLLLRAPRAASAAVTEGARP